MTWTNSMRHTRTHDIGMPAASVCRILVFAAALFLAVSPATAQAPPACLESGAQQEITIADRALMRHDFRTTVTLGSRVAATDSSRPAAPAEVVFCLVPRESAFTSDAGSGAQVLVVSALTDLALLRVEIYRGRSLILASDGAAPQHRLLLTADPLWPADPKPPREPLFIVISREDAGRDEARFVADVRDEPLSRDTQFEKGTNWFVGSVSEGNAFLYTASAVVYERLMTFARCDWLSHEARHKSETPTGNANCLATQMAALSDEIYPFVSGLAGRVARLEFHEGQPRAARSEPMVVFFGLGGANKVLLLDCRDTAGSGTTRRCEKFAEPWQTTLQRARYVWGIYIEDAQTPFNTSIDVEFKANAPSVDYEEYDPRGLAGLQMTAESSAAPRLLRVGVRRFRVREPPVAVQMAFSRQGPNYGLRQWVRVYHQFSARWFVVSGAVLVPAVNNAIPHVELIPVPPAGGLPARLQIEDDRPPAPIFATLLWRWPQVRARAENRPTAAGRLIVNLIPDIAGGISVPVRRHNSYFVGGSWPILGERLSFMMGMRTYRAEEPVDGFTVGQIVPAGTRIEDVRTGSGRYADLLFGLAVELVRSR